MTIKQAKLSEKLHIFLMAISVIMAAVGVIFRIDPCISVAGFGIGFSIGGWMNACSGRIFLERQEMLDDLLSDENKQT